MGGGTYYRKMCIRDSVYTNHGKMNLFNAKYELDDRPIEEGCNCPACRSYSRAVSYTHLDVYKRQEHGRSNNITVSDKISYECILRFVINIFRGADLLDVSLIHNDNRIRCV